MSLARARLQEERRAWRREAKVLWGLAKKQVLRYKGGGGFSGKLVPLITSWQF